MMFGGSIMTYISKLPKDLLMYRDLSGSLGNISSSSLDRNFTNNNINKNLTYNSNRQKLTGPAMTQGYINKPVTPEVSATAPKSQGVPMRRTRLPTTRNMRRPLLSDNTSSASSVGPYTTEYSTRTRNSI